MSTEAAETAIAWVLSWPVAWYQVHKRSVQRVVEVLRAVSWLEAERARRAQA